MKRVLVVCLGNICRSPIGEEMLRLHAKKASFPLFVDSAGTSGWHQGNAPDPRSCEVMRRHGHSIDNQRSRPLTEQDLQTFDCILAMDSQNISDIHSLTAGLAIVERFVKKTNVPDPYYGEGDGFERVYEMIDEAAAAWIRSWSV
jgi:protein-tyrosine phosphatase